MKLLIAGGGTGGHLFPGIAVAEEFLSRDPENEVLFVGTGKGIEARVLPQLGYRLELVSVSGLRGKGGLGLLKGAAMMLYGYSQARRILKEFAPDLVLGVGGYASAPVLLASRGMLIPRYVHEQNAIPGMANKLLSRIAKKVFVSLEESARFFPRDKTQLTGNPLRRQILDMVAPSPAPPLIKGGSEPNEGGGLGIEGDFQLLVFGGSLGAHSVNLAMAGAAPLLGALREKLVILHQTGEKDLAEVRGAYERAGLRAEVVPFINDMAAAYRRAGLVLCRAGATTIAEVTACGKPCLFIPFPHAVDDHQRKNAEALLKKEACEMLLERELSPEKLAQTLAALIADRERLERMAANARSLGRLDAGRVIVDEMLKDWARGAAKGQREL